MFKKLLISLVVLSTLVTTQIIYAISSRTACTIGVGIIGAVTPEYCSKVCGSDNYCTFVCMGYVAGVATFPVMKCYSCALTNPSTKIGDGFWKCLASKGSSVTEAQSVK